MVNTGRQGSCNMVKQYIPLTLSVASVPFDTQVLLPWGDTDVTGTPATIAPGRFYQLWKAYYVDILPIANTMDAATTVSIFGTSMSFSIPAGSTTEITKTQAQLGTQTPVGYGTGDVQPFIDSDASSAGAISFNMVVWWEINI